MKSISPLLWRRVFPSHVSTKEFLLFTFGCAGFEARIRKRDRVRGHHLLDDIAVLIPKILPQVIFDVGAHHGESIFKIYNLLRHPVVHSFEPSPISFDRLKANFQGWPGLHLNNRALGESSCRADFHEYDGSPSNSPLLINRKTANVLRDTPLLRTVTVEMETLDGYCSAQGVGRIDWLKIDAQGYDLNVLKGARRMLGERRITLVSLEVNFIPMYEGEGSFCDIVAYLDPLGYKLVDLYDKNYVNNRLSCCDLLFVRDEEMPSSLPPKTLCT